MMWPYGTLGDRGALHGRGEWDNKLQLTGNPEKGGWEQRVFICVETQSGGLLCGVWSWTCLYAVCAETGDSH